jgi:hypothetical protein
LKTIAINLRDAARCGDSGIQGGAAANIRTIMASRAFIEKGRLGALIDGLVKARGDGDAQIKVLYLEVAGET